MFLMQNWLYFKLQRLKTTDQNWIKLIKKFTTQSPSTFIIITQNVLFENLFAKKKKYIYNIKYMT